MNVLLVFVRNPEYGKVKSRLAATLGDAEALRIYRILLEKTHEAAKACPATRWVCYSDFLPETDEWESAFFEKKLQEPVADLGRRMEAAFEAAFASGAQKAVIIGSDCPELIPVILEKAFQQLDQTDLVIGPSADGGYYLLGMKEMERAIFQGISWSTDTVLQQTLEHIRLKGKTCALLQMLDDVDTEEDWLKYLGKTSV